MEGKTISGRAVVWIIAFVALAVLENAFVMKFDVQETPVALGVAALAGATAAAAAAARGLHYRPRFAWLALLPRLALAAVRDTGVLAAVLARRLGGALPLDTIDELPFRAGGDDPEDRARRAVAIAAVAVGPNTIPVRVDRERGTLLVHRLDPRSRPQPSSPEWPL